MLLKNLSAKFPAEFTSEFFQKKNALLILNSILPLQIRFRLQKTYAREFPKQELSRRFIPRRDGLDVRPFGLGDPLKAVSLPLYLKTGELYSRVEKGDAEKKIWILIHIYPNMFFRSNLSDTNKLQVSLAVAIIIAGFHHIFQHSVEIVYLHGADLEKAFDAARIRFQNSDKIYFLTDLFFDPSDVNSSIMEWEKFLKMRQKKATLFVLRDKEELLAAREKTTSDYMTPYDSESNLSDIKPTIRNEYYWKELEKEKYLLEKSAINNAYSFYYTHESDSVLSLVQFLRG